MLDLHRHDEFSSFDGFGKAKELAELAKQLGHTSLSVCNHGNTNGLVKHYEACKEAGINCIMGVEAYFQPKLDISKPRYHLCLFAKNLEGYQNINKLMYIGEKQKYYNPIVTFKDLGEYSSGIICTSACIAGFVSDSILNGKEALAEKALLRFVKIFGNDFYIEIQPYKIMQDGVEVQRQVNYKLIQLAQELKIKCVLTSDSHYGRKEEFDTYLKMHEIAKHTYDIEATYGERYMPSEEELIQRFKLMHMKRYGASGALKMAYGMVANLGEIEAKVEQNILDQLQLKLPVYDENKDSYEVILEKVKQGLKQYGKYNRQYIDRCKQELAIIKMHGFADYFLIVADYVQWAKDHKIYIGPGRGSVCNCQVAWALGITDVDSLRFDLDFRRFLREDKKKLPDIDLDFETSRRQEVIDYLIQKYHGHSAQVCSYGLYKVDNLVNDLAKVCGVEEKEEIKEIKDFIKRCFASEEFNFELAKKQPEFKSLNKKYDNIIVHFARLFKKMRFIGTHAAGVAITGGDIKNYCAIKITKEGREYTVYDLADLDIVHVVKFDMLGLKTMESIGELRELTGNEGLIDEMYEDPNILEEFKNGNTDGIFQFESGTAKSILKNIQCDCFEDIVAASSMNRPGPLSTHMPEQYAVNKFNIESAKQSEYYKYTKSTYGTVVYQEQIQQICVEFAGMSWSDSDRVMKLMKNAIASMGELKQINEDKKKYTEMFAENVYKLHGMNKQKAEEMFKSVLTYTFNKGHGVGYGMISLEEMYYRVYYPTEFWYVKLKYAGDDGDLFKFSNCAVANGTLIFLPHVNYTADYSIRKVDGEQVIQAGLVSIKGVGGKAAAFIEYERKKHGPYSSKEDFIERCKIKGSPVNKGVVEKLIEEGALEFSKKTYLKRVTKYNSTLYMKGMQKNG